MEEEKKRIGIGRNCVSGLFNPFELSAAIHPFTVVWLQELGLELYLGFQMRLNTEVSGGLHGRLC